MDVISGWHTQLVLTHSHKQQFKAATPWLHYYSRRLNLATLTSWPLRTTDFLSTYAGPLGPTVQTIHYSSNPPLMKAVTQKTWATNSLEQQPHFSACSLNTRFSSVDTAWHNRHTDVNITVSSECMFCCNGDVNQLNQNLKVNHNLWKNIFTLYEFSIFYFLLFTLFNKHLTTLKHASSPNGTPIHALATHLTRSHQQGLATNKQQHNSSIFSLCCNLAMMGEAYVL